MNAADQAKLGALLDMGLAHAGLEVVRPQKNGAAIVGYEAVDGVAIVARLMAGFGWSVRLREWDEAERIPVERMGFAVRPEAALGRADARAMLRLVRPELEQGPGDHEAGHADEGTPGGHPDVTEDGR